MRTRCGFCGSMSDDAVVVDDRGIMWLRRDAKRLRDKRDGPGRLIDGFDCGLCMAQWSEDGTVRHWPSAANVEIPKGFMVVNCSNC